VTTTTKIGQHPVRIYSTEEDAIYTFAKVDTATNAVMVVDYSHHEIHGGSGYLAIYSALKADTEFIEVRIQTPNTTKWAHMVMDIECALAGYIQLWMNTTKTHVTGNAIVPMNRDHNSSSASGLTLCHTPAGTESATAALAEYVGAAASGGRVAVGGEANSRAEFILKQNTAYLIRATSRADGNALSIILDWYEHTNN
jgi:hypothetical protein